jgi:outer membrane lipoprotein SlyB
MKGPGMPLSRLFGSRLALAALVSLALSGCATQSQDRYSYQDVGHASVVEFGTVLASRQVDIKGQNTGMGAGVGAAAGGIALSGVGQGAGNAGAVLGGIVAGAIIGAVAEQMAADRVGLEYTITLANGKTITIVQDQGKNDRVFAAGDAVMVQASGTYQRVLPADRLPSEIAKPKSVKIVE